MNTTGGSRKHFAQQAMTSWNSVFCGRLWQRSGPINIWVRLGSCAMALVTLCMLMGSMAWSEDEDKPVLHIEQGKATILQIASKDDALGNQIATVSIGHSAPESGTPSVAPTTAPTTAPPAAKVVAAEDGNPKITVTTDLGSGKASQYQIAPNATVTLNGSPAKIIDLQPGDDVQVDATETGVASAVRVYRTKTGIIVHKDANSLVLTTDYLDKINCRFAPGATLILNGKPSSIDELKNGDLVVMTPDQANQAVKVVVTRKTLFEEFWDNFRKNLFKPLLLFFYMGFAIPLLRIAFEFPNAVYQGLTIYLLISIGWHGGEELAVLSGQMLNQALGFIVVGFSVNFVLGCLAYFILRHWTPRLRAIDAATVAAYYGSDSAGTFVTCLGVLQTAHIAFAAYMPVMLAVMEIPGCLVGLYLVSRLRKKGMDKAGYMPNEPGYDPNAQPVNLYASTAAAHSDVAEERAKAIAEEKKMSLENVATGKRPAVASHSPAKVMREVFLNPGLFLLFGGILVGFASRLQGAKVVEPDDKLFVTLFQGMLCLFLLEMGMTASKRLKDLKTASWRFIVFGLVTPNIFATLGMIVELIFSHAIGQPFQLGTYVLFAVLCGAASYIAVPAIQRLAIPEASPTLPLAASLGLTFSYNVTIGIPVYIVIAQTLLTWFPVATH